MTSIRQRMRRLASAEAGSPSPEAEPGTVADPATAGADAPDPQATGATGATATPPEGVTGTADPAAAAPGATGLTGAAPSADPAVAAAAPGAAPPPGVTGAAPADVAAPAAGAADPNHPGFATRGRLRRRLRYLRRVRELGYRDLGGLVFDQHRFARPNETLVQTKVAALAQIDGEVRALERALEDKRAIAELREAGIAACPRCGAIHGSESRYCPACGLALSGPTELAPVGAPMPGGVPVPAPAPTPPNPVTIAPMPAPVTPPIVGPAQPQPPVSGATAAPTPAPAAPPIAQAPPAPTPSAPVAPSAAAPAAPASPGVDAAALQHTIHLRADDEQPTTVFKASDVSAGEGVSIASGDPLTGPRPADAPDLQSGDPLAPRPEPDASDAGPESEPRS